MNANFARRRTSAALVSSFALAAAAILAPCRFAFAGLEGQPGVPKAAADDIQAAATTVLRGDIATGRPKLFLLVEKNATTDLTDLLGRVAGDDTTYNGLLSTFEEAEKNASGADRAYLIYNETRLSLLRANLTSGGAQRAAALDTAAQTADRFDPDLGDWKAWELKGDIASYRSDLEGALASYRKMSKLGVPAGFGLYKQGMAYLRANQPSTARGVFLNAYNSEKVSGAGGPDLKYNLLQALALVYLAQGNETAALDSISASLKVSSNPEILATLPYKVEAARALLRKGYTRQVSAYVEAGLHNAPENADLLRLRSEVRSAGGGR